MPLIKNSLNGEEQLQIVHWLSEFKTAGEIQKLVKQTFNKNLSRSTVDGFLESGNWASTIQKLREKYSDELFKVELSNSRRRIEELESIYYDFKTDGKLRDAVSVLHEIHEQLKKPESLIQNNYQMNVYKEMTDEEFDQRELELIKKRKEVKEALNVFSPKQVEGS